MKRPVDTINKAIVRQGKTLSGRKWYRTVMSSLLLLAGVFLLYQGWSEGTYIISLIGAVFVLYSLLVCFFVRKAEDAIAKASKDLDVLIKTLEEKEKGEGKEK